LSDGPRDMTSMDPAFVHSETKLVGDSFSLYSIPQFLTLIGQKIMHQAAF